LKIIKVSLTTPLMCFPLNRLFVRVPLTMLDRSITNNR